MKIKSVFLFFLLTATSALAGPYQVDFVLGRVQYRVSGDSSYEDLVKDTLVQEGALIRTGKGSMVKLIDSQGSKIMVLPNSTFRVAALQEKKQDFEILAGGAEFRVRSGENLSARTPTLSAGVRGTLFRLVSEPGGEEQLVVYEGKVAARSPLFPEKGEMLISEGSKIQWNPAQESFSTFLVKDATEQDLDFFLKEDSPLPKAIQKEQSQPAELKQEEMKPAEETQKPVIQETVKPQETAQEQKENPEKEPSPKKQTEEKFWQLDFSLGGMEKSGQFYHSLMVFPGFKLGKWITLTLFLPVYYDGQSKIYQTSKWGNSDEWDFSSSKDAIHDALLKIHSFQFREKGDILYARAGTLDQVTVGSGFMFNGFNPSPLFPMERTLGLELGFDMGISGLNLFLNDLYDPEIIGGRFFFRPLYALPLLGKFQIGLQGGTDKNPLGTFHNPAFFYLALDFTLPLIETDLFSVTFFSDIAKQGLYYRDWDQKPAQWADGTDVMHFHLNDNYGADAGFKGAITRLIRYEFRYYYLHSGFEANYFDSFYLIQRQQKLARVLTPNLQDSHAFKAVFGMNLEILSFTVGYYHSLSQDQPENRFSAELKTKRGAFGRFFVEASYEKKDVEGVFSGEFKKDALLDVGLGYMFTGNADIVARKLIAYYADGTQESRISLETRFIF